ncbi:MAG: aspartate aminotransferase family protein [Alphaproteobacteria bacterium]
MADYPPIKPEDMPALMPVYQPADVYFERGEGCYLFDDQGERYLDFGGAIAVTAFGHANPVLVEALHVQAKKLWIASNYYKSHLQEKVAKRLVDLTFADTAFFQNSGVEAWELGIKIIRKYFSAIGKPERYRVITFKNCFHGRTLAAISAAKAEKLVKGFGPPTDGFDQVELGDLAAVEAAIGPQTAAVVIEPIQGDGGIRASSPEFLRGLRALCDRHGLLLYFDEIQCGMGRTGKLFAHEWAGIVPDVMCIAKSIGNGFPVSACLASAKAAQGMTYGVHGSTYGGNPLAMAVVDKVLDLLAAPGFLDEVARKGWYLEAKLNDLVARHPQIYAERRGMGMMQGLRCAVPEEKVRKTARERKLLVMTANENVFRLLPALTVTETQIDDAVSILHDVAAAIQGQA